QRRRSRIQAKEDNRGPQQKRSRRGPCQILVNLRILLYLSSPCPQDRSRPYDTFNLHSLENSLMDMIRTDHEPLKDAFLDDSHGDQALSSGLSSPTRCQNGERVERYSRKVFVGGLPPDIDEDEITASFRRFGPLVVDWPHKAESKSYFPPKGAYYWQCLELTDLRTSQGTLCTEREIALPIHEESSVQALIDACLEEDGKLYLCVSSPTIKDKPLHLVVPLHWFVHIPAHVDAPQKVTARVNLPVDEDPGNRSSVSGAHAPGFLSMVQIRPWNLSDSDFVMDGSQPLDPRKTIFVGGVPRPLRAVELAMIMDRLYGGVCYAGIDTDPELKYPKGAGRVAFSNQQSYIAAISARFVQLQHNDIDKRRAWELGESVYSVSSSQLLGSLGDGRWEEERSPEPLLSAVNCAELWLHSSVWGCAPTDQGAGRAHREVKNRADPTQLRLCSRVEVKPYVLDDQMCDECQGTRCGGKFAPFFCANVTCLQYYCEYCWASIHSRAGREFHKPL
ncbi:hypothetical protein U0070_008668, partial [Myodes glareolus]